MSVEPERKRTPPKDLSGIVVARGAIIRGRRTPNV